MPCVKCGGEINLDVAAFQECHPTDKPAAKPCKKCGLFQWPGGDIAKNSEGQEMFYENGKIVYK